MAETIRKVLFCGSRYWTDRQLVWRELIVLPQDVIIVHGKCPVGGLDAIVDTMARQLYLRVRPYPADFDALGPAAGPLRNQKMLDCEHPDKDGLLIDRVYAFHFDERLGRGTRDMISRTRAASIPERIIIKHPG